MVIAKNTVLRSVKWYYNKYRKYYITGNIENTGNKRYKNGMNV